MKKANRSKKETEKSHGIYGLLCVFDVPAGSRCANGFCRCNGRNKCEI